MNNENITHIKCRKNKEVNVLTTRNSDRKVGAGKVLKITKEPNARLEDTHDYYKCLGVLIGQIKWYHMQRSREKH